ncbi:helicase-related protein [Actinoplanes xinjiangensis]|uniref:Helicase-like protein n=1 Tax=Actinoplanes xinjiangensis TaxID=512350 RepID=A0A316EX04_9ACTN|nr:helicase-related protein [Actinoplanes xinjiangensis]PWK35839.1 helicase-like protein [Actinoplanes xinjiangensis]GIF43022.1 hypothetical protein Axi01nite_73330 [Actinoplanes xinjiangensis]
MSDFTEHFAFRDTLTQRLVEDVLGPAEEHEILTDPPATTYLTGVLYPQRDHAGAVEESAEKDFDLGGAETDVDDQPDSGVSLANVQNPSSMGLSFAVHPRATTATITVTAATYQPVDEAGNPVEAQMEAARSIEDSKVRWRRLPVEADVTIDLRPGSGRTYEVVPGLEIRARVRPVGDRRDATAVTVTLVNNHPAAGLVLRDQWCFFQCGLRVDTDPRQPTIIEQTRPAVDDDDETLLAAMLYHHAPTFATGHGCAVDWDPQHREADEPDEPRSVTAVWSSFTPRYDVLLAESNPEIDTTGLRMIDLARGDDATVIATLRALIGGYRVWVEDRETEAAGMADTPFGGVAVDQAGQCRGAYERMDAGIDLLAEDPQVMRAFRLANHAMAVQRARTVMLKDGDRDEDLSLGRWYPFQLGFLLLCLRGIADPDHADRRVADLLWFPTGGGKTEAYLGLVAFTVFLRRIRNAELGAGVTILMRYTLRLLTLQQFERATTLICAMERLRQQQDDMPGDEISIGMWVGRSATPNHLEDAEAALKKLRAGNTLATENPVQLRRCAWCGVDIDAFNYSVDHTAGRLIVACGNTGCFFESGLPVHLIDAAVYRHRPTLIIATVDKFAQMAWKEEPAALFNRSDGTPAGTPPPELIIQDELHLISGPLGTLVGLYETVLDIAAQRPKVIASTATIRRAQDQGRALFDRDVHQFPPSGLDSRDSWFAVQAPPERKPSRRYIGLFAPGSSQASLLIRAYAALLHHAATVEGKDEVRDAYWTLLGYFNSLRLLASAELQVNDDVVKRIQLLTDEPEPPELTTSELTSRVAASEIPKRLRDLDTRFPHVDALQVVLATNMISVGVDVDRLGLMAVTGQPQTTAEYIQSTSRVGRRYPGLVVMLYNAARSRDRSHYERFRSYHSALYRQVESTSVTPFSARARDRALHAVLVSAARVMHREARPNGAAKDLPHLEPKLRELSERILARVAAVAPDEVEGTRDDLEWVLVRWQELLDRNDRLVYDQRRPKFDTKPRSEYAALLRNFDDDDLPHSFPTMNSLRDVDVETNMIPREGR